MSFLRKCVCNGYLWLLVLIVLGLQDILNLVIEKNTVLKLLLQHIDGVDASVFYC